MVIGPEDQFWRLRMTYQRIWLGVLFANIFLFVSCSRPEGENNNTVVLNFQEKAVPPGGMMIFGSSGAGTFARVLGDDDGTLTINLPASTWTFYAIRWNGPSHEMQGPAKCGKSAPTPLAGGGVVDVDIEVKISNCAQSEFSPFDGAGNMTTTISDLVSCADVSSLTPSPGDCERTDGESARVKGYANHYQIHLMEHESFSGGAGLLGPGLSSQCMGVNTGKNAGSAQLVNSSQINTDLNIPLGGTALPIFTQIQGFNNLSGSTPCGPVGGSQVINLPNGISPGSSKTVFDSSLLYVEMDKTGICSPANKLNTPFAAGDGFASPIVICNEGQWNAVSGNWSTGENVVAKDVILGNDLDFKLGDTTFNPFGEAILTAHTDYLGFFDGNNKVIRDIGFILDQDDAANVGIGIFRGIGANSVVRDLTTKNLFIFCDATPCNDVRVIGKISGTTAQVFNINANGNIGGETNVGGIIGRANAFTGIGLSFTGMIDGNGGAIGGLIGKYEGAAATGQLIAASFDGDVNVDGGGYTGAGGIIGDGAGSDNLTVEAVKVSGSINGDVAVGGFFGIIDGVVVNNSYSTALISSDSIVSSAGGLVGRTVSGGPAATFFRTFFSFGSIDVPDVAGQLSGYIIADDSGGDFGACSDSIAFPAVVSIPASTYSPTSLCSRKNPASDEYQESTYTAASSGWFTDDVAGSPGTDIWNMDDDGFDIPRLYWEALRPCSGKFSSPPNNIICTPAQFVSKAAQIGNFNVENDLNFAATDVITNGEFVGHVDQFRGKVDLKNNYIANFFSTNTNGSIKNNKAFVNNITSSGSIKNGRLVSSIINGNSLMDNSSTNKLASLAITNNGIIDNIQAFNVEIKVGAISFASGTASVNVGGLVVENSGIISNSISGILIRDDMILPPSDTGVDPIYFGGLVAINQSSGLIENSQVFGEYFGGDGATDSLDTHQRGFYGGVSALNQGTIRKTRGDFRFSIDNFSTTADGVFGGISAVNNGTVVNVEAGVQFTINTLADNVPIGGIVGINQSGGDINFVSIKEDSGNVFPNITVPGGAGGKGNYDIIAGSNAGTIGSDFICAAIPSSEIDRTPICADSTSLNHTAGDFDTSGGTFVVTSSGIDFNGLSISSWNITDKVFDINKTWVYFPGDIPELQIPSAVLGNILLP